MNYTDLGMGSDTYHPDALRTDNDYFQVGAWVEITESLDVVNSQYGPIKKGTKGIIRRIASTGSLGIEFSDFENGHNCNEACKKSNAGLYLKHNVVISTTAPIKTAKDEFAELYEMI